LKGPLHSKGSEDKMEEKDGWKGERNRNGTGRDIKYILVTVLTNSVKLFTEKLHHVQ